MPVAAASVQLNVRGGGAAAVYAAQSGGAPLAQPLLADAYGRVTAWVDRGSYDAVVTIPGMAPYTIPFEIAPAGAGSIDSGWIAARTVPLAKLDAAGAAAGLVLTVQASGAVQAAALVATGGGGASPGQVLYEGEWSAQVPIASTSSAAPTAIITADPITFDGATTILVELWAPSLFIDAATTGMNIGLFDGSTLVSGNFFDAKFATSSGVGSTSFGGPYVHRRHTPAAGTRTLKWAAYTPVSGANLNIVKAATGTTGAPITMRITREVAG